jgi:hypothetical protein
LEPHLNSGESLNSLQMPFSKAEPNATKPTHLTKAGYSQPPYPLLNTTQLKNSNFRNLVISSNTTWAEYHHFRICKWPSGQLAQASLGSQLAIETLRLAPSIPLYLPSPKPSRRTEVKQPQAPIELPSKTLRSPYPDAPAVFLGSPQLETTP